MKIKIKLDVYFVTDRDLSKGRPIEDIVAAAAQGGATIIQLREKECSTREFIDIGIRLNCFCNAENKYFQRVNQG